jgi:hypothetical protein
MASHFNADWSAVTHGWPPELFNEDSIFQIPRIWWSADMRCPQHGTCAAACIHVWTKTAENILRSVTQFCQWSSHSGH